MTKLKPPRIKKRVKKSSSRSTSKLVPLESEYVSLKEVAEFHGLSTHAARLRLNKGGMRRHGTRWRFKRGSPGEARAYKLLSKKYTA